MRTAPAKARPHAALLLLIASFACSGQAFTGSGKEASGRGGASGSGTSSAGASAGKGSASLGGAKNTGGATHNAGRGGSSGVMTEVGGADSGTGGTFGASGGTDSASGGVGAAKGGASDGGVFGATGGFGANGGMTAFGGSSGASSGGKAGTSGALSTGGKASTGGALSTGGTEPIGGCDRQILANAEFDQGPTTTWNETSTWPGVHIVVPRSDAALKAEAVPPHSGEYLAWLGGIPDNEYDHHLVVLTQKVTIPVDAAQLTLSGRYWVKTLEDASQDFDEAYLEFEGVDESVVWQALRLTNRGPTTGWTAFEASITDLDALRGQTITFTAYSRTDPTTETSFFLDSLLLVATCGR